MTLRHEQRRRFDARREQRQPWRKWYRTKRWRMLRAEHLARQPLCWMCLTHHRRTSATIVDHKKPHRGNEALFYDPDNLASLCPPHHNGTKQREERGRLVGAIGADGWPLER